MFKSKLFSSMIVVLCLFCVSALGQTAPATKRGTRVTQRADDDPNRIPYITCASSDPRKIVNIWLGDYQGKQSVTLSGRGLQSYSKGIYNPTKITATKSADGKICNLAFINKHNQAMRFAFEMSKGPLHIGRQTASNTSSPMICNAYENSAFDALKNCTVPPVRTKATMPAACRPEESSLSELAYTCQVTGPYIQQSASHYSMKFCEASPRGAEARVDKVCVARASCTRRSAAPQTAYEKTRSWPNVFPSYVVCRRDMSGKCGMSADDCRSDKTLYFTNEKRGESIIRVDVGLDMARASAPASAPAAAPPVLRTTDVWRTMPVAEPPPPEPRPSNQPSTVVVDENGDWAAPAPAATKRVRTQVVPTSGAQ